MRRVLATVPLVVLALMLSSPQAHAVVQEDYCVGEVAGYSWCYNSHTHSFDGNAVFGGNFRKCVVLEYPSGVNVTDTACTYGSVTGVGFSPNCCTALRAPIYNGDNNRHNMSGRATY